MTVVQAVVVFVFKKENMFLERSSRGVLRGRVGGSNIVDPEYPPKTPT
jgi:hypothetical protein